METPESPRCWDAVIVGQGLAGSCLAWQLHFRGWKPLLMDAEEPVTASKIAAGLITPITGQRMVPSWQIDTFFPAAQQFYLEVENLTWTRFFQPKTAIRLLMDEADAKRWEARQHDPAVVRHSVPLPSEWPSLLRPAPHGAFAMRTGRLDVPGFLAATRSFFQSLGQYRAGRLPMDAVMPTTAPLPLPGTEGETAQHIILCQGYTPQPHPLFSWVKFKAARGDILTLKVPATSPCPDIHAGLWLAQQDAEHFLAGATYDWKDLSLTPSAEGRASLKLKLASLLRVPFTVVKHTAAVRPIISESKGLLGRHPTFPRFLFFNGLGSKGSLHAPLLAQMLAEHLANHAPLPDAHDLQANGY